MSSGCIRTFTGRWVDPLDLKYGDVCIEDVAHSLSLKCRYTGHVPEMYSVARHSLLVTHILGHQGHSWEVQMAGLLHDATEAYLPDVSSPTKRSIYIDRGHGVQSFSLVESGLIPIIHRSLGVGTIPLPHNSEYCLVHVADKMALTYEMACLFHKGTCLCPHWIGDTLHSKSPFPREVTQAKHDEIGFLSIFRFLKERIYGKSAVPNASPTVNDGLDDGQGVGFVSPSN